MPYFKIHNKQNKTYIAFSSCSVSVLFLVHDNGILPVQVTVLNMLQQ